MTKNNESIETPETTELTPEQVAAIEEKTAKYLARLNKGAKIWNKIKTPLVLGAAATGGFLLRGALTRNECPLKGSEDSDNEFEDTTYDNDEE